MKGLEIQLRAQRDYDMFDILRRYNVDEFEIKTKMLTNFHISEQ